VPARSVSKIVKDFLEFEDEKNLFSLKICGYNFWEHLRYSVWNEITNIIFQIDIKNTAYNKPRQYREYPQKIFQFIYSYFKNHFLTGNYQIIFLNTSRNRIIDGRNVDMYIQPIMNKICKQYNVLLINQGFCTNKKNYLWDIYFYPFSSLENIFLSFKIRFNKNDIILLKKLKKNIFEKFKVEIDIISLSRTVISYNIYNRKRKFVKIFKRFRPNVFVYVDDGSMQGILEAAHNHGVTTIELQHSTVSNINPQYQWSPKSKDYNTIPKYIFSFGKFWHNSFNLKSKIIPTGFPYFDIMSEKYSSISNQNKSNNVLINSSIISKNDLIRITLDLIDLLDNCKIYFKLRPEEYDSWKNHYPKEIIHNKNIIMIDNNETHLYKYFTICKYQIGVNSTTIYEGLGSGLTTFILQSGWYEEMTPLIDGGYVFLIKNAKEIASHIKNNSLPKNSIDINSIFQQNSLQSMRNEMESLIRE